LGSGTNNGRPIIMRMEEKGQNKNDTNVIRSFLLRACSVLPQSI
jgi:hypothetical protein